MVHKRLLGRTADDISIYLVDGKKIRDIESVDFTMGGHGYVFRFIPRGEIWIDDRIAKSERGFTIRHELWEYDLMSDGVPYGEAHRRANIVEKKARLKALRERG